MMHSIATGLDLSGLIGYLAQVSQVPPSDAINTPEEAALIFSGPRFFIALIAGIVLAFGFQLLLTNFSVAAGISILGSGSSDHSSSSKSSSGMSIQKIGTAVGLWTLVTVSLALFIACLLAVKLSLINNVVLGGIVGLVIWGTYFSLLVWISSTTVGSLVGSLVNAAVSGFQAIIGTASAAIGAKTARDQIVATAESAAAAVRRELTNGLDAETVRENLEDYLEKLRPSEWDVRGVRQEFEQILQDPALMEVADADSLQAIDRQVFVDLISRRTDLSKREVNRLADQLESVWQGTLQKAKKSDGLGDLIDYLKSAKPGELLSNELGGRLDQLIDELRLRRQADSPTGLSLMSVMNALMGVAIGRVDLSDLDVEKITGQIKSARDRLSEQADKVAIAATQGTQPYSVIRSDVEDYLLNTYAWQMAPQRLEQEFRSVLYDPDADPTAVRREIERLNRADFADLLQSRGIFTQDEIRNLSLRLEQIRKQVLQEVTATEQTEKIQTLRYQLEEYIRLAPRESLLNAGVLAQDLRPMMDDADANADLLRDRFRAFDQDTLMRVIQQRPDLNPDEARYLATEIDRQFNLAAADAVSLQEGAKARVSGQWHKLEDYLRQTGKDELNPTGIKRDLQTLLDDPQAGVHDIRVRMEHFDRDTLVQLLSQRPDLSEAQANEILDQVETNWYRVTHAPQIMAATVSEQYDKATSAIADYLRRTGKDELNPDGIYQDLKLLLDNPQMGMSALRYRLAEMDRDTLVKLMSQRSDISEDDANRIIDQVQTSIRQIVRAPRRLAIRTQNRLNDFRTSLEDYLRNTNKIELNPDGIKRDLQLLLNDPRLGAEKLRDRLSLMDRSTIVALLSQREDISEAEANRIVDQVLSVREQVMDQIHAVQQRVQSVIDSIFARIRAYLNSLERPELNYDGIKTDLRTLFDDPEAGFDALRDRLAHVDRGTLVAILSSREDISEADANRIIGQVERVRDSVLQRAERVQSQVQRRLEDLKHQVQEQAEETRKAAATAAWWLFATALISATASAIAGGLAVAG